MDMRDGRSCKSCEHYAICSAECHDIDTEAIDCGWYKPSDEQAVPCAECAYFEPFEGGRLVRARCPRTGTAFLRQKMGEETAVLDPKLHTCREAAPKSQTFAKER